MGSGVCPEFRRAARAASSRPEVALNAVIDAEALQKRRSIIVHCHFLTVAKFAPQLNKAAWNIRVIKLPRFASSHVLHRHG